MVKWYDGERGPMYRGSFKEDLTHGEGTEWRADGALYKKGRWEYGDFLYGDCHYIDGRKYVGHFRTVLVGAFNAAENVHYGKGKMYDKDGRLIHEDTWDGGRHISGKRYDYSAKPGKKSNP